ncbi:death-associated APAF1-related killer isoform X2 [Choristoneura fumiferana]|uniref:death-associated APAF1-related killer isoform X2 n=1 Tax=Choristoneura fumiferana TaxID=7141 RepID=UPI003D1599BE
MKTWNIFLTCFQTDIGSTDDNVLKQSLASDCRDLAVANRGERTRYLLDVIAQNGDNNAYQAFVDSLFKDYHWLWEKLNVEYNEPMFNSSFEDSLSRGDVPRLPEHYVQRTVLEQEVVSKLEQLTRHKILALHGMPGSGKTSVALGALRYNPDLINTTFNGAVFWLNFGNCKTQDDIVSQQNKLYRKASSMYMHNSYMNSSISMSSIGSNADSQSLSSYDWTWQELRDKLKSQFAENTLKESLLVLDEVNEKKHLEAFDIGCKILITTRDTDVVDKFQAQIIKIGNHFLEKESLELFASCLDVETNKLPRQAKKMHDICKGNPFSIAMLGAILAENKQRLIHDPSRWSYYVNKLQKKDFLFLPRNDNPIKVCINALDSTTLQLFKMLAVLPDNAKFSAKVIGRLWNKDVSEVETIMKQLRKKCLIIEDYIYDQKNYVYEIHDLIMDCLRTSVGDEEMKKLHADFLKRYHYDNINTTPVEIVDDGYIAFYIGYHIHNSKNANNKCSLFNKLYLDLKFLGNKVKLTGPADVILDLQKYEDFIVVDDLDKDLLYAMKAFLSTHGIDLYRYPYTDLVQSILQHESKGILYSKATAVAAENCAKNELYFEFLHEQNVEEVKHSTIDVKESIRCVCFLGDYVLVGTLSGSIKVFNISTNNLKKELAGNGSPIKWIGACPVNPPIVAALSFEGVIKMWYIDDVEQDETDRIAEEDSEESFNNNYPSSLAINPKTGPFINCRWANEAEILIAHTSKMVILYDPSGKPIQSFTDLVDRDRDILCCVPSNDDRYLIIATSNNKHYVEVVDTITKEKVLSFEESDTVLDILTVPGTNRIIILMHNEVLEHELELNGRSQNFNILCRSRSVIASELVKSDLSFLSIAVNKAGSLLFVSTDDSRVICIDLKTQSRIFDLENRRGDVISMSVSEVWYDFMPGSDVLLTGTGTVENSAKVWHLDPSYVSQNTQKNGKVRLTTRFDVSFVETQSPHTPSNTNGGAQSSTNTPKRIKSFVTHGEVEKKKPIVSTMSLDRHTMKPCLALNLKGICNVNNDGASQPLLAVVDDKHNIQIMRGRKLLTEIITKADDRISALKISPCNQYIIYGMTSGYVKKYTLRSKETKVILDVTSTVQYLNFVNPNLLIAAGKNRCLMAYRLTDDGTWRSEMLQKGNSHLGSQEILNDIQGIKKKNGQSDKLSNASSDSSLSSRERTFPVGDNRGCLSESTLVNCFWIPDRGLMTVEYNATVKLWDQTFLSKLPGVLNGRQVDIHVTCAAFKRNILVLCDDYNKKFHTFELKDGDQIVLQTIQEYKLNNKITSCDLTSDGTVLAMGLHSGEVVLWNVQGKRQLRLLKHHKAKVQWCAFSPLPDRLFRSSALNSPVSPQASDDNQPPLVLVTMATEIVWWNITYLMKTRPSKSIWRLDLANVVSPLLSPVQPRTDLPTAVQNMNLGSTTNFFFREGVPGAHDCWKELWKAKTYKEGSKRKEILACIKLSGMNAKKLCFDDKFSCFVTVDNPGHTHIMKVMSNT